MRTANIAFRSHHPCYYWISQSKLMDILSVRGYETFRKQRQRQRGRRNENVELEEQWLSNRPNYSDLKFWVFHLTDGIFQLAGVIYLRILAANRSRKRKLQIDSFRSASATSHCVTIAILFRKLWNGDKAFSVHRNAKKKFNYTAFSRTFSVMIS